jgi:hypothetical protein
MPSTFNDALHSKGPAQDRAERLALYGWLVGDWEMDAIIYRDEGTELRSRGEIHAGWVLEGRAIQDVWIVPGVFYGTTLRVYDPGLDAWHILWSDPLRQYYSKQIGRARGTGIVQEGASADGTSTRWSFTEMTPESFHWIGEKSDGQSGWIRISEFLARRLRA